MVFYISPVGLTRIQGLGLSNKRFSQWVRFARTI